MRLTFSSPASALNNSYNFSSPRKNSSTDFSLKPNKLGADTTHFTARNALHVAAEADNATEIEELINKGVTSAELNEGDDTNHGRTPIQAALANNAAAAVKKLIRLGGNALNTETQDDYGRTAAHYVTPLSDPQIKRAFEALGYRLTED